MDQEEAIILTDEGSCYHGDIKKAVFMRNTIENHWTLF